MADNISQIKERLSVVDVISGYIKVQKSGINFKARCPFHNEKTPSFYISPERQIWHCFGCQKGGDIFSFIKDIEGVEFPEALQILAQRAGVKLERFDSAVKDEKAVLYEICETTSRFFEKQLHHSSVGKVALKYLKDRGLADGSVKEFRLGFAPEGWHNLAHFLRDCGYEDKDIVSAGVVLKRDDGSDVYDRFRSRIIFPIADINDRIVGFTGRVFEPQTHAEKTQNNSEGVGTEGFRLNSASSQRISATATAAKYINTPQTAIYDKSRVLYGLNKAKTEVRQADRCLLVEGNIDVIMSYQAGVKNTAATSGTALTPSHLQLLQRYTNNLDFCFDTDVAGLAATRRGLGLALSQNLNVKIVHLQDKDCKDPADYVKKYGNNPPDGKAGWREVVLSSKPVLEFYFDKLRAEVDLTTVDGKKAIISSLGPLVKRLSSHVEKSHWVSRLAAALRTKEEAIEADILSVRDDLDVYVNSQADTSVSGSDRIKKTESPKRVGEDMFGEALLAVIVKNPVIFGDELPNIQCQFLDPVTASIIEELKNNGIKDFKFDDFVKKFEGDKRFKLEFAYLKAQEFLKEFSEEDLKNEFFSIKKTLERKSINLRLSALEMDIKAAESTNEKAKLAGLLIKFNNLTKELNSAK